jgi:hypothetical protein
MTTKQYLYLTSKIFFLHISWLISTGIVHTNEKCAFTSLRCCEEINFAIIKTCVLTAIRITVYRKAGSLSKVHEIFGHFTVKKMYYGTYSALHSKEERIRRVPTLHVCRIFFHCKGWWYLCRVDTMACTAQGAPMYYYCRTKLRTLTTCTAVVYIQGYAIPNTTNVCTSMESAWFLWIILEILRNIVDDPRRDFLQQSVSHQKKNWTAQNWIILDIPHLVSSVAHQHTFLFHLWHIHLEYSVKG